jgi:hypothetical protein
VERLALRAVVWIVVIAVSRRRKHRATSKPTVRLPDQADGFDVGWNRTLRSSGALGTDTAIGAVGRAGKRPDCAEEDAGRRYLPGPIVAHPDAPHQRT